MKSQVKTYDEIYNLLRKRLNKKGTITTNEAWKLSNKSYPYTATVLRSIMNIMVKKGYAEKVVNGRWIILVEDKC